VCHATPYRLLLEPGSEISVPRMHAVRSRAHVGAVSERPPAPASRLIARHLEVASVAIMALALVGTLWADRPPPVVPADAAPERFSAERAMRHLTAIATLPRPIGSPGHLAAERYIVGALSEIGVPARVVAATGVSERYHSAGSTRNIVARLPGTTGAEALAIVAHYDSVPSGPGAGDNAAAVAALLECVRALKSLAPLRRDLVVLFSDGEEVGLLGAESFVAGGGADHVGIVLNVDAAGSGGPLLLFETSPANGWLLAELATLPRPGRMNSAFYEVYRTLSRDTDLTPFVRHGKSGLNFAFVGRAERNHTKLDGLAGFDQRTLQDQGAHVLAVARHFGDVTLGDPKADDEICFDVFGRFLVHYPRRSVPMFFAGALILSGAGLALGLARRTLKPARVALAICAFGAAFAVALLTGYAVWVALWTAAESIPALQGGMRYADGLAMAAAVVASLGSFMVLYGVITRRVAWAEHGGAAVLTWAAVVWAAHVFLPEAEVLVVWPLIFLTIAWLVAFARRGGQDSWVALVPLAGTLPAIAVLIPVLLRVSPMLSVAQAAPVAVSAAALLAMGSGYATGRRLLRPRVVAIASACGATVLAVAALARCAVGPESPRLDSLVYVENADTGSQLWVSSDRQPDRWTSNALGRSAVRGPVADFAASTRTFLQRPSATSRREAPVVDVTSDEPTSGGRLVTMTVRSPRQAPILWLSRGEAIDARIVAINERRLSVPMNADAFVYYGVPPGGVVLSLLVESSAPSLWIVRDVTYGLPSDAGLPGRPAEFVPAPARFNDCVVVTKNVRL
jgi:hypothetical protein